MASLYCKYNGGNDIICVAYDSIVDIKVNGNSINLVKTYPYGSGEAYYQDIAVNNQCDVEIIFNTTEIDNPQTDALFISARVSSVVVSDDITSMTTPLFAYTNFLKTVTIGSACTTMGYTTFMDCENLETIYVKSQIPPTVYYSTFYNVKSGGTLYYPSGSDYSQWLSTDQHYLGYYGWNGVEMDPEDMPDGSDDNGGDNELNDVSMEVYVNNSPIVFGYQGGYKSSSISIGGNAFKDGFEVSEFKNLESSADWLEFSYEEGGSDDGKTYYYYFDFNCSENMKSDQRMAICSGEYVLTDGRTGTFSFVVYQDANGLIDIKGSNPLIFQAYERGVAKETEVYYEGISYVGNTSFNTNIDSISVKRSSASNESSGMLVDYEITMNEYNVYENDITGAIEYVLMDPDTSEDLIFEQQAVIRGCQYPFGLKKVIDGEYYDIGTKDDVKTIIVPASGGVITLQTYYPFYMVVSGGDKKSTWTNTSIDWDSDSITITENEYMGPYQKETHTLTFPENTTEETKTATLTIQYRTEDHLTHTDTVNFIQLIGNGEDVPVDPDTPDGPYVTGTTTILYFNYDGTPKTTNEFDVYWYGDYYDRNIANDTSQFGVSGKKIETTDDYVKYHYTVNCPRNTTSEEIIGSCYFNIKLDASTYGESFIVEFRQDANPEEEENPPVVNAFTQIAKVKIDGTPEMASFTDIACGYAGVEIQEPLIEGNWIHLGTPTTGSGIGYDTVLRYPISFDANDGEPRQGKITFSGLKTDGETLTSVCTISQAGTTVDPDEPDTPDIPDVPVDGEDYIGPIWKDVEFDFGTIDIVEYGIFMPVDGYDVLLFAGRTYLRPNGISNKIIVNKMCQDYMEAPLLDKDSLAVGGGYQVFKLKSIDGSREYRTYRFVNDWSYDDYFNTGLLSHPILKNDNKVYKNQLLPFTVFGASETVGVTYGIQYGGHKDEYGNVIPDWSNGDSVRNNVVTEIFPYSGRTKGAVSYTINGKKYDITEDCTKYVLYYVNPWGGYDWFPIRGKVVEKDTMTSYTYTQNFNNQTWEFGKRRYLTSINKHFTLHTEWMSEDESSRMWYLLQSNVVYLHNLKENKVYPVIITNTEQEHKKRLRGTRISYQIEVDLSQNRERI